MQWGFTLGSGPSMQQWLVNVPDGAYPPQVGEQVHFTQGLVGTFTVQSRIFTANMPMQNVNGNLVWGWTFVIA